MPRRLHLHSEETAFKLWISDGYSSVTCLVGPLQDTWSTDGGEPQWVEPSFPSPTHKQFSCLNLKKWRWHEPVASRFLFLKRQNGKAEEENRTSEVEMQCFILALCLTLGISSKFFMPQFPYQKKCPHWHMRALLGLNVNAHGRQHAAVHAKVRTQCPAVINASQVTLWACDIQQFLSLEEKSKCNFQPLQLRKLDEDCVYSKNRWPILKSYTELGPLVLI